MKTTASKIYNQYNDHTFSYGEVLSIILENNGKGISSLPNEDFLFPDKSVIRITNNGMQLMEFLQE
jgi:hypothetical protein